MRFSIRESLRTIRFWLKTNWNKEHLRVVWEALSGQPYDHSYYTELEIAKLEEMIAYHKKSRIIEESERKHIIFWMEKAKRMLEIADDPIQLVEYDGHIEFEPVTVDTENGKEECYELKGEDLKRRLKVYINTRNIDRFVYDEREKEFLLKFPEDLYARKAKHIYAEIWKRYLEEWWD